MNTFDVLKSISEAPGPSGYEKRVRDLVLDLWEPLSDEMTVDRVGSLVAVKRGQGPEPRSRVLLAAHMDEIGLMVTKIESYPQSGSGFLRVINVGGVDKRQLIGQKVVVHGSTKGSEDLIGVIGVLPGRMRSPGEENRNHKISNIVVDVGLPEEELKNKVSVGDFITFRQQLRKLENKRVTGKALDNRVSLVVLTRCLQRLQNSKHDWDVIAVATAQEETALLGAFTSGFAQRADVAIAVDVTFAKGPGVTEDASFVLGEGPAISIGPNVHPGVNKALHSAADRLEMKVHVEPHARMSGTDAIGLQMARQGIPTGLVSIPLRYMHTTVESVSLVDIKRAGRLIAEFIVSLDDSFLSKIADELMPSK
jgi:endoglucanase